MDREEIRARALALHEAHRGKLEIRSKVPLRGPEDLSLAYTPGVAEPCLEIHRDRELVYRYTNRGNLVAVVTDGSAVLGLGDIGPEAAYPVMEGKCVLFKAFAGVDAVPVCLNTQDSEEIVETVARLEPTFGAINLEDISAPRCFFIEEQLKGRLGIPVFHDDQHGTAVVTAAAFLNALRVVDKKIDAVRVVINGAGAAGLSVAALLMEMGVEDLILCDREGAFYRGFTGSMNPYQESMLQRSNPNNVKGTLADALQGADVFIGVSAGGLVDADMVASMRERAVVLAMANPVPEIYPEEALRGGAAVVATGRSDFPNQINNVLAFPGILAGVLEVRARDVTEGMKRAAAHAIADLAAEELSPTYIIPGVFDPRVAPRVAGAVAQQAVREGMALLDGNVDSVEENVSMRVARVRGEVEESFPSGSLSHRQ